MIKNKASIVNNLRDSLSFLMIVSLFSKCMGFLRDLTLSYFWGANVVSDAFVISMTIPGTICDLLIQAVAVGYIPTFTEIKTLQSKSNANQFTIGFLELLLICCIPIFGIMLIYPEGILKIFASGFNVEAVSTASTFLRITGISVFCKMICSVLNGFLQSNNRYIIAASTGIPFDIIIIVGIVLSTFINPVVLPISVLLGGIVQAGIVIVFSSKIGLQIRPTKEIITADTKKVLRLLLPLILIVGANQLNSIIDKTFASFAQTGSLTIIDYANKVCLMLENVIVFSIVAVAYPKLGEVSAKKNDEAFAKILSNAVGKALAFLVPTTIFIIIFSESIISVLFGRGAFTYENVVATSSCMIAYSLGMISVALRTIYTRALYAAKKVKSVTVVSLLSVVINVLMNLMFMKPFGLTGLALATSFSAAVSTVMMFAFLHRSNTKIIVMPLKKFIVIVTYSAILCMVLLGVKLGMSCISDVKLSLYIGLIIGGTIYLLSIFFINKHHMKKSDKGEIEDEE